MSTPTEIDQEPVNQFDEAIKPGEPSIFKEGHFSGYLDSLFLEWIYLYEPKFYFKDGAVLCYFKRDGKPFGVRAVIQDNNVALAIRWCIKCITEDRNCFANDKKV